MLHFCQEPWCYTSVENLGVTLLSRTLVLHFCQEPWCYTSVENLGVTLLSRTLVLHFCREPWCYTSDKNLGVTLLSRTLVLYCCQEPWCYTSVKNLGVTPDCHLIMKLTSPIWYDWPVWNSATFLPSVIVSPQTCNSSCYRFCSVAP